MKTSRRRRFLNVVALLATLLLVGVTVADTGKSNAKAEADGTVSYYQQVRPILQAKCHGCHQPAKAGGEYVMTAFDRLSGGGESGEAAIVAGKPDESLLVQYITPVDGEAEMPRDADPLAAADVDLIRRWVSEGAVDDTPAAARQRYDVDHPPLYTRPPVITSLDFSPDGQLLAIAGFHEVLLANVNDQAVDGRLIGVSERIESVQFSPDGKRLAVTGGLPGRMGEIQVWDVAERRLLLSVPTTSDTVYGGSWSPDGKLIAYGAADNRLRAIDAETGEQVVYMAAHNDWVRGTVFSADSKSIFSVSRDKTVKMTDVATQRFVGNVTTHTPGILLGGMIAIDRHPARNELLVGGADGAAKLFKMDVKAAPAGGGNPNQIRAYAGMPGRLFTVCLQPDGARAFAGSSLDGTGQLRSFETDSGKEVWKLDVPESGIFALACAPDGKRLAAAGADGSVRLIDAASGAMTGQFLPVQVATATPIAVADGETRQIEKTDATTIQPWPQSRAVAGLVAEPAAVRITSPTEKVQLIIAAQLPGGAQADATRSVTWSVDGNMGTISQSGLFTPARNGSGTIVAQLSGQRVDIPLTVSGLDDQFQPDFIRDVNPILSRLGCNAGTCHGAAKGQNGFKLSLRGYDALQDTRAFTDDLASRRTNVASPDDSLMLLKPTAAVPHHGGQLFTTDEPYYAIVRDWIAAGAKLDLTTPRVTAIELFPKNPVVQQIGSSQQIRVVATYADGRSQDVTRESFIATGNSEVATADQRGLMTAVRRGEAPVLARYEGAYAATTLTVMGDRTGFAWQQPETWGRIDELVAAKWQRMQIQPAGLCSDAEFLRRVYFDLTGLPPTADEVRAFLADQRDLRTKRDELVDKLIGSEDSIEYWTNKWADLLQVNRKFLGKEGAVAFRKWIRDEVAGNTPYDQFARKILTAGGSNRENPAASYYKVLREPVDIMENTTHLFLAIRFNCNKCHDHPFERWTQNQYYETAAYFARVGLKKDPASGKNKIGGTAVEGAKPLYEIVADKNAGEVVHDRTKQVTPPQFPFECNFEAPKNATRRQQLTAWLTSPDNPYFARSYVNRLWGYLFGVGIIEPIDDIRAGNPPTNPELLDYLTQEFLDSGFNVRHVMRLICTSRTYQLSIDTRRWNEDDKTNYSHALARRLPAEALYDAVHRVTGSVSKIPGVPPGTRAAALPDSGVKLPDGFLNNLGRPPRQSACECERTAGLQLGPVMALISGPTVGNAIADPQNELAKLAAADMDDTRLIDEIFMRILNRPATQPEIEAGLAALKELPKNHDQLIAQLQQYELQLADRTAQQQQQRQAAIDRANAELADYQQQHAPRIAEQEKQRNDKIAMAETAVKAYQQLLPAKLTEWEQQVGATIRWTPLDPVQLSATNNAKLTKQQDLSVFVSGPNGKGTYTVVARTELAGVTGVKLELFSDERLPKKGPGRAQNGNFVLTEFRVEQARESEPQKKTPVELQNAQADFSQGNYDIKTAIDKKKAPSNNGWATAPKMGQNRTAVFETAQDTGSGPVLLTFSLDQEFADGKHSIGRFRISATTAPRPVTLDGLPKKITDIFAIADDQRNDQQRQELLNYYRGTDAELNKLQQAVAEAKKPLAGDDPRLKQLRDKVAEASKPLPPDPRLVEMRRAVEISAKQLDNRRLTFTQDLTWALINNPAFLFNR